MELEEIIKEGYILFDKETAFEELPKNYKFMKQYDCTITKGNLSEIFSAKGTKLNDKLRKNNDLLVRKIYNSLKLWHKSYS